MFNEVWIWSSANSGIFTALCDLFFSLIVPALIIDLCPSIQISRWWTLVSSGWFTNSKDWCSSLLCPSTKVMLILPSQDCLHMDSALWDWFFHITWFIFLQVFWGSGCSHKNTKATVLQLDDNGNSTPILENQILVTFFQCNETQREVFQFSVQNLSLEKLLRVFEGNSRNAYIRQGASNQQCFLTMLSKLAQSRIIWCCVSKRNSKSEPGLIWYPCTAADRGTARDNRKVFQLENKWKKLKSFLEILFTERPFPVFIFLVRQFLNFMGMWA